MQQAPFLCGNGRKPLIVTDPTMIKLGYLKKLTDELDMEYAVWSGIEHEPDDTMIEQGAEEYQKNACDSLIALGGGSAIDSMKAIGLMIHQGPSSFLVYGKTDSM
jgi:alcohol dehydrogenase class IV